ncbi:hypothetical protein HN51_032850 [Arachis hypogaea]|nr:uncharacterized protein DS421_10g310450 [Arachis hypogaea]
MASKNMTTSTFISLTLILSSCIIPLVSDAKQSINIGHRVTVELINSIEVDLTIHCKSKDDDLGFHTVPPNKSYQFGFKPSIIRFITTLFFCSFDWPGEKYNNHHLNVYEENRDACTFCSWKIYRDGGKMLNPQTGKYELNYTWN